jgi:hypothetical protein
MTVYENAASCKRHSMAAGVRKKKVVRVVDASKTAHEVQTPWLFTHKLRSSSSSAFSILCEIISNISELVCNSSVDMATIWSQGFPAKRTVFSKKWKGLNIVFGQVSSQRAEARVKRESVSIRGTVLSKR